MSRFVSVQGGRRSKAGLYEEEEPWGTTASNAHYRAFDAAERSTCRSSPSPMNLKKSRSGPDLLRLPDAPSASGRRSTVGSRRSGDLSHIRGRATPTARSISGRSLHSSAGSLASAASAPRLGPIPEDDRPFCAKTSRQEDEELAREARQWHFPGRDETISRGQRLPAEMALAGCSRESVRSASTAVEEDVASVYTVESSASGMSKSYASTKPQLIRRVPTADSERIRELPGSIARQRARAQLRAPNQWEPDRQIVNQMWNNDGCLGLCTANFVPRSCPNLRAYEDGSGEVSAMAKDNVSRIMK